jgi:hypothetical protein
LNRDNIVIMLLLDSVTLKTWVYTPRLSFYVD